MADRREVLQLVNKHLNHLEDDFDDFCNVNDSNIVSHAERYHEGIIFNIHLADEYYLIISSVDYKIREFHVLNLSIHKKLMDEYYGAHFNFNK